MSRANSSCFIHSCAYIRTYVVCVLCIFHYCALHDVCTCKPFWWVGSPVIDLCLNLHPPLLQLIRAAWQAASERLQGFDELSQASLRFRRALPGEPASADPHVLRAFEVGASCTYRHMLAHVGELQWEQAHQDILYCFVLL